MRPMIPRRHPPDRAIRAGRGTLHEMEKDDIAVSEAQITDEADDELVDELLIEEISIDGMCGVY